MSQAALFDPEPSMTEGQLLRERGTRQVEEVTDLAWVRRAEAAREHFAQTRQPFTIEDIDRLAGRPDRENAAGAIVRSWARRGLIWRVGDRESSRPERRAGRIAEWRALG